MTTAFVVLSALMAIVTVTAADDTQWIDYRLMSNVSYSSRRNLSQSRATRDVDCKLSGKICDPDCERVWVCINNNGNLVPKLEQTCEAPQTCNNGVCSDTPSLQCSPQGKLGFKCTSEGIFPDPLSCKGYHYCIDSSDNLDDFQRECGTDFGYNARTGYCQTKLTNDNCGTNYPVPLCTTPGQNAALKENPSLYYVCSIYENAGTVLYPYLYLCENGKTYAGNFICK